MIESGNNESMAWYSSFEEVRYQVRHDGKSVWCRVSRECIQDHFGNPTDEDECLSAAKAHFEEISDNVELYISLGRFEADGSILLRTADWR